MFKLKTAYEMRISDWSSDVCSSDLRQEQECLPDADIVQGHRAATRSQGRGAAPARADAPELHGRSQPGQSFRELCRAPADTRPRCTRCQIGGAACMERVCQYVEI